MPLPCLRAELLLFISATLMYRIIIGVYFAGFAHVSCKCMVSQETMSIVKRSPPATLMSYVAPHTQTFSIRSHCFCCALAVCPILCAALLLSMLLLWFWAHFSHFRELLSSILVSCSLAFFVGLAVIRLLYFCFRWFTNTHTHTQRSTARDGAILT